MCGCGCQCGVLGYLARIVVRNRCVVHRRHRDRQRRRVRATLAIADRIGDLRHRAVPVRLRHERVAAIGIDRDLTHTRDRYWRTHRLRARNTCNGVASNAQRPTIRIGRVVQQIANRTINHRQCRIFRRRVRLIVVNRRRVYIGNYTATLAVSHGHGRVVRRAQVHQYRLNSFIN